MARLWQIANVAEAFHVLPSAAARDLHRDPEQLSLVCLGLLRYAEAWRAYRSAADQPGASGKALLDAWRKTTGGAYLMALVTENDFPVEDEREEKGAE